MLMMSGCREAYIGNPLHPPASLVVVVGSSRRHAPDIGVADRCKIGHAAGAVVALKFLRHAIHFWHLSAEGKSNEYRRNSDQMQPLVSQVRTEATICAQSHVPARRNCCTLQPPKHFGRA